MKRTSAFMTLCTAIIFGTVGLCLAAILVRGFVLSVLWGWFAVPLGAPALGVVSALGLSVLLSYLLHHTTGNKSLSDVFIEALAALSVGYVFHLFM
jgi:hypothetical protein